MSRSGSLGFYDLASRSGYFHYPIVHASCWINMIPAGGLVVVPEGSSSCVCGYNYKTSMAFVAADRQHHFGVSQTRFSGPSRSCTSTLEPPVIGLTRVATPGLPTRVPWPTGRPLANAKYGPRIAGGKLSPGESLETGSVSHVCEVSRTGPTSTIPERRG